MNREHALKTREIELKKQEKAVKERLAKLAEEKEERLKKAQEESFLRDIEHLREKNDKSGETYKAARVSNLSRPFCRRSSWR